MKTKLLKTKFFLYAIVCSISIQVVNSQEAPGGVLADLNLWLRADQGLVGSSNVSEWTDQSPNGNNAVQAVGGNQPMIFENATNFHASIDFDGTDDIMNFDNDLGLNGDNAFTLFGIMQMPSVPAKTSIIATDGCGDGFAWYQENFGDPGKIAVTQCGTDGAFGNDVVAGETTLRMVSRDITGPHIFLKEGGNQITGGDFTYTSSNMVLGETNGLYSDIHLSELLVFNRALSINEIMQVHSYLSLKYGITLDQNTPTDYVDSNSDIIWNATANTGYHNDIFGIGRDDASGLNQKISKSANNDNSPILATTADFTSANMDGGRTSLGDGNFMVMGHNNGPENSFTSSFNGGSNNRSSRVWKVDETGAVGNVYFAIPYSVATFPSGGAPAIVISNDQTFDDTDEVITLTYDRTNGIYTAQIDPADGDYLALAISEISVAIPAYYRTSSGGDGNTTTDGITTYSSYEDFIADTSGTYTSFSQHWSFEDSFFSDGVYFYRTNNAINQITRYPSIDDIGADTNGVTFNLSQTWDTNDEFFASGNQFFRTSSPPSGTDGLTAYSSFADLVSNTNGATTSFATTFAFADQFFHDGVYFLRTSISGGNHVSVSRYASLTDLATDVIFDTQTFGPWSTNDDIFAIGITASFTVSETTLTIDENAGTGTFTVVLDAQPLSDVVLDISSDDVDEATVSSAQLTFTTANWDTPQTVTVTGVNDNFDNDDSTTITIAVDDDNSDNSYDALADQTVSITLTDDDTAAYTVSETTLTIDEDGGTDTFTVVLDAQPASNVVIDVSSDDTNDATVDKAILTFTTVNWNVAQTIAVTGINDNVDRDDSATITMSVDDASSDDAFDALADQTISITLTDDDTAAYTVSETTLTIDEDGGTDTFTVVLDAQPTSNVVFNVASNDTDEATVNIATLTFTTSNWNQAQTVTVTGVNDAVKTEDSATITVSVKDADSDDAFDTLANQTVAVTLTNDDASFSLAAISNAVISENTSYQSSAPSLSGDAPIGDVVYTLSGDDATKFTVNSETGVVSMVARDFENPEDDDADNEYDVTLIATDSKGNSSNTSWYVAVTDDNGLEVLTQIGLEADNPDSINSVVTAEQLNTINGITGVIEANETAYQDYIDANPESFSSPALLSEVQGMVSVVNATLGVGKNQIESFVIYPNPASGILSVEFNNSNTGIVNVDIYNALGQKVIVKTAQANSQLIEINIASLNSGVYFIKVETNKTEFTKRIVKE